MKKFKYIFFYLGIMKVLITGGSGMVGQNIKSLCNFREHVDFAFLSGKDWFFHLKKSFIWK